MSSDKKSSHPNTIATFCCALFSDDPILEKNKTMQTIYQLKISLHTETFFTSIPEQPGNTKYWQTVNIWWHDLKWAPQGDQSQQKS